MMILLWLLLLPLLAAAADPIPETTCAAGDACAAASGGDALGLLDQELEATAELIRLQQVRLGLLESLRTEASAAALPPRCRRRSGLTAAPSAFCARYSPTLAR